MELKTKSEVITTSTLDLSWLDITNMLKEKGVISKEMSLKHIKCPPDPNKDPLFSLVFESKAIKEGGENHTFLDQPISKKLSAKTYNALITANLLTPRDVQEYYKKPKARVKNIGDKGKSELEQLFHENNMKLFN